MGNSNSKRSSSSSLPAGNFLLGNDELQKQCECNTVYVRAHKVKIVNVPLTGWSLNHLIAHAMVEVHFKCNSCNHEFVSTMDFGQDGKNWKWKYFGRFRLQLRSRNIDQSYEFVKQKFDEMRNDNYHFIFYNCIHWAGEFFCCLTGHEGSYLPFGLNVHLHIK